MFSQPIMGWCVALKAKNEVGLLSWLKHVGCMVLEYQL